MLLEKESDFQIVGEAADGLEAVQVCEESNPDVLLLDLVMPGLSGLDVARHVNQTLPETRIVILSMYADEEYALAGLRNGISGYVAKDTAVAELVQAIHQVMSGKHYFSAPLSEQTLNDYAARTQGGELHLYEILSNREREVLTLIAEGHKVPQIAGRLSISRRTVETYQRNLLRKLNLETHAGLIRFALTQRPIKPK